MRCENELCLYYIDQSCTLGDIQIDALGQCAACLQIQFTEAELAERRARQLQAMENQDTAATVD